jgi:hypothetical protein
LSLFLLQKNFSEIFPSIQDSPTPITLGGPVAEYSPPRGRPEFDSRGRRMFSRGALPDERELNTHAAQVRVSDILREAGASFCVLMILKRRVRAAQGRIARPKHTLVYK